MVKNEKSKFEVDDSLKILAEEVTKAILCNRMKHKEVEPLKIQKKQVDQLLKLEESFRKTIIRYLQAREVYKLFCITVTNVNKNILSARPYFREKSKNFSKSITPAIKNADLKKLQTFHINYQFIKFVKDNWKGPFPKKAQSIYDRFISLRSEIIENNMPLVINRSKLFYRKVPKNHLSLMDIIGISATGLISGVDKWVGSWTRVFNGVCIGRMTGNVIDGYSETTLHFYPSDRSVLYRANSIRFRQKVEDVEVLADLVNKSYEEDKKNGVKAVRHKINPAQLADLLNAASPMSSDLKYVNDDGENGTLIDFQQDQSENPEESLIKNDLISKMILASESLSVIQRKVLKLKGVRI